VKNTARPPHEERADMKLTWVHQMVNDVEATKSFYADLLGLEVERYPESKHVLLNAGETKMIFFRANQPKPEWRQGGYWGMTIKGPTGKTIELYNVPAAKPAEQNPVWAD
jgi:catechol-2,3-dioxygenase